MQSFRETLFMEIILFFVADLVLYNNKLGKWFFDKKLSSKFQKSLFVDLISLISMVSI